MFKFRSSVHDVVAARFLKVSHFFLLHADTAQHQILINRAAGRIKSQSGGSTGVPTAFYHDKGYWNSFYAAYWLGYQWCGYHPGDRQTFLWGADADAPRFAWSSALKQVLHNSVFENAFQ